MRLTKHLFVMALMLPSAAYAQSDVEGVIRTDLVVFVSPDSTGLERLKEKHGEENFYVIADDEMYYRAAAYDLLDSLGLAYSFVERRTLRFEVKGEAREYTWSHVEESWFVVIYRSGQEPRVTHSIDLSEALGGSPKN